MKLRFLHLIAFLAVTTALGAQQQATIAQPRGRDLSPSPGMVRENPKDALKYVWIPPGTFMMGCSPGDNACQEGEKPTHKVNITKGFWMGQTEVTVGAYKGFITATGKQMPPGPNYLGRPLNPGWGDEAMPIVEVTWKDAQAYCSWVGGRLPTEAEYEYAARAGSQEAAYGELADIAWYADNSGRQPLDSTRITWQGQKNYAQILADNGNGMHEVGKKLPNSFGLYDMLGNVWEWVNDRYAKNYYRRSPSVDPMGPVRGQFRAFRGGSWIISPAGIRVSNRRESDPGKGYFNVGFRCGGEMFGP